MEVVVKLEGDVDVSVVELVNVDVSVVFKLEGDVDVSVVEVSVVVVGQ